jgi:bisanhydrobacterioruberin hydratase
MKKFLLNVWNNHRQQLFVGIVMFFWLAGFAQTAFGLEYVIKLTPIVLALLAAGVLFYWDAPARRKVAVGALIIILGYFVELIGVKTGVLFGDYSYGTLMGYKVFGVPLTIGITWLLVCVSAWNIVLFGSEKRLWVKLLYAGGLVVMFDLILEQFAVAYSFWSWANGEVPLLNYVCWFVIGAGFAWLVHGANPKAEPSFFAAAMVPGMAVLFWLMLAIV